jgi:hypothetical protein
VPGGDFTDVSVSSSTVRWKCLRWVCWRAYLGCICRGDVSETSSHGHLSECVAVVLSHRLRQHRPRPLLKSHHQMRGFSHVFHVVRPMTSHRYFCLSMYFPMTVSLECVPRFKFDTTRPRHLLARCRCAVVIGILVGLFGFVFVWFFIIFK